MRPRNIRINACTNNFPKSEESGEAAYSLSREFSLYSRQSFTRPTTWQQGTKTEELLKE